MATSASTPERILQRLDWQVIRRLDGLLQGDYRSLFHGYGVDFADLREYQPGDDVRYIDWNVTARMDTPYVRQYIEDREITAWFLLDLSPSVDFGTVRDGAQKRSRPDRLRDDAGAAADAPRQPGRRGASTAASVERTIPARGGRIQVLRLDQRPAATSRDLPSAAFTDLTPAARGGPALDQAALAGLRRLGLHQRAGLGAAAQPAQPAPRGARRPPLRPARGGAARRRSADRGGRRDRRAALRRHPRPGASGGGSSEAAERREATLRDAFKRSGVDAVVAVDRRGPGAGDRPDGDAAGSGGGGRPMSFVWPAMLLLLAAIPLGVGAYLRPRAPTTASGRRATAVLGVRRRPRRRRPCESAVGSRRALARRARRSWSSALARPQASSASRAIEGTVILAFDVSGQHGRDRPRADPDGGGQGRRPGVRRAPAARRSASASSRSATAGFSVQVPTSDQAEVLAAIDRLQPGARHVGRPGHPRVARRRSPRPTPIRGPDYYSNRSPAPTPEPTPGARRDARAGRRSSC